MPHLKLGFRPPEAFVHGLHPNWVASTRPAGISASIFLGGQLSGAAKSRRHLPISSFKTEDWERDEGRMLQVMPVAVVEFKADPSADDTRTLR
jgi:hypothetical protein